MKPKSKTQRLKAVNLKLRKLEERRKNLIELIRANDSALIFYGCLRDDIVKERKK